MAKMKLKTLSGAKKRFKMTASGKIKKNSANRRHILTKKTTKLTRGLRMPSYVDKTNEAVVKKMLPYG
ncbi:MAG: 50S ribosomal protein L35 [Gemmiger sp.]|nr:50S ribosomal protein L35 [Gemmiger sp.]